MLDIKFVGRTPGVTQEEGYTGFLIHLLFAVRALIFLARRILQPFLSLVDREVEFCVLTIKSFSTRWAILVLVFRGFFSEKNPVCRGRTHVPTCQKVTRLPLSYRGDRCNRWKPSLRNTVLQRGAFDTTTFAWRKGDHAQISRVGWWLPRRSGNKQKGLGGPPIVSSITVSSHSAAEGTLLLRPAPRYARQPR